MTYNRRLKLRSTRKVDTKTVEVTVYRYRNNYYFRDSDNKVSVLEYERFLQKMIFFSSYLETFNENCIAMVKQLITIDLPSLRVDIGLLVLFFHFYPGSKYFLLSRRDAAEQNLFLSVSHCLDNLYPHGGLIGNRNSNLDTVFRFSVVVSLHTILHDTLMLFMYRRFGPNYCHLLGWRPSYILLGLITGLLYCFYLKIHVHSVFNLFDCWLQSMSVRLECRKGLWVRYFYIRCNMFKIYSNRLISIFTRNLKLFLRGSYTNIQSFAQREVDGCSSRHY